MKKVFLPLILFVLPTFIKAQTPIPTGEKTLAAKVSKSVVLLYEQDEAGGMTMLCTGTAYRKIDKGYRFVSAAHCVSGDDDDEQSEIHFFVTADNHQKTFIPVTLIRAGDKDRGDDFSIFEAVTEEVFEVTPLGDESTLQAGDAVLDISGPHGLGKMTYFGYVTTVKVDRPQLDAHEVKWNNPMIVSIGGGPGSSGAAIVSLDQKAIVGFFVGEFSSGDSGGIVVPVSQFKKFEGAVDAKTYIKKPKPKSFLAHILG
jgi:S1-C subfamily serine protease